MFKKVLEYAGPYKRLTMLSAFVILIAVLMSVLPFLFVYQIITPLVMGEAVDVTYIGIRVLGVAACLILHACLYVKGLSMSHEAAFNILFRLRVSLQKRMEKLPLGEIQEKGIGSMKRMFVDDVDSIELLLAHALPEGFGNVAIPIIVYISLFAVDWKLALMSLASLPIGLLAMVVMYRIGMKDMKNYYAAGKVMNNTIVEYINGMEVVKVFNKDGESYKRFEKDITAYRDFTLSWYKACWPWMAIYNSILPCTLILTLPLGSWFVLKGYSTLADLILVMCLSLSLGVPLLKAMGFLPSLPQINYKIEMLENMFNTAPLKQTTDEFKGNGHTVVFDGVSFAYKEETVADQINLTIPQGQKTALVGESGSGKSTLAKLLVHYYDTNQGTISIGGQDICQMSLEALNTQISYVSQEQFLFNTSLMENIRIGRLSATDEKVLEAAKKAQCMEFLEKLPKGIHTLAGDSGKQLSGGQRQRIALARAILKDAPIVVLDEAMAFTDPENEEKMEAAISEVVRGKTLLVIAHRLPSVKNADQICVMSKGKIIATGRHEELIVGCEEYQKLWNASIDSANWKVESAKED
ncbi:MAG TPA: ABC transporter ATP-binding protein [Candidatus Fimimorpha faecalis]|uniref:ABC transporter ATP-binding protein n=1 Tax=Candidatus Fimimorpha faecalis TaxID=2840824 RepID=A0A9D1EFP7_9FIRM|nr:ABC transporter ATP-binding protein [Candidatus Fimimorpha faecalis]